MAIFRHITVLIVLAAMILGGGPGFAAPSALPGPATATEAAGHPAGHVAMASAEDADCIHCLEETGTGPGAAHKGGCGDGHCLFSAILSHGGPARPLATRSVGLSEPERLKGKTQPIVLPPPLAA